MDRQSIIQSTYLKNNCTINDNSCGEEICECAILKTGWEKTQLSKVATIAASAFACALGLTVLKINMPEKSLQNDKAGTIACGSQGDEQKRKKSFSFNDYQSNKNNNGTCPHPQSSSVLGCCDDPKRKKNQGC